MAQLGEVGRDLDPIRALSKVQLFAGCRDWESAQELVKENLFEALQRLNALIDF
jgi:hypothetical protein